MSHVVYLSGSQPTWGDGGRSPPEVRYLIIGSTELFYYLDMSTTTAPKPTSMMKALYQWLAFLHLFIQPVAGDHIS